MKEYLYDIQAVKVFVKQAKKQKEKKRNSASLKLNILYDKRHH